MKPHLILVSHGEFAKEALKTAELIVGNVENAMSISMTMEEGGEGLKSKMDVAMNNISSGIPIIIMVDIISGTPCNVSVLKMYERENVKVITGLNLAMIIEYAVSGEKDLDILANYLVSSAKEVTKVIEKTVITEGEYED